MAMLILMMVWPYIATVVRTFESWLVARLPSPWLPEECKSLYPLALDPLSNLFQSSRMVPVIEPATGRTQWAPIGSRQVVGRSPRLSRRNLAILVHILSLTFTRTIDLMRREQSAQLVRIWALNLVKGGHESVQLCLDGMMIDEAQKALQGGSPRYALIGGVAVIKVGGRRCSGG
jgi:hypothetical protein